MYACFVLCLVANVLRKTAGGDIGVILHFLFSGASRIFVPSHDKAAVEYPYLLLYVKSMSWR